MTRTKQQRHTHIQKNGCLQIIVITHRVISEEEREREEVTELA